MRAYYMTSFDVASKHILPEQRIKVSRFPDLNDPFELAPHDFGDKMARLKLRAYMEEASKRFGLICFSDNWKSPVMWAHYANKHKGVCLGFDIHKDYLAPVQYVEARILHRLDKEALLISPHQFIDQMLYHKAREWSYEQEMRAIVLLDGPQYPMYHITFGLHLQLREVIIGCRNPLSPRDLEPLILPQETSVQIVKARPAFKRFEMTQNLRYKTVTVQPSCDCSRLHEIHRKGPRFITHSDSLKR